MNPSYHILVALGDGPKHGYAIMQDVAIRTEGEIEILPGTLYSTIKRLIAERAIEECAAPVEPDGGSADERRRYYRLTAIGRAAVLEETDRMAMLIRLARKKGFASTR
ncbi:MAG TPA: PadR family transcriptional regulator [Vicinamibacteria bacterium]|nr:PadR family transcriptional regulator [Vicinamibacteria bacterium]